MTVVFRDRVDAGRRLAARILERSPQLPSPVVLGLPRGGVVVAFEVAQALSAPLDVIVVRKLGVPQQPELAMGAIGEGGLRVLDPRILDWAGVTPDELAAVERRERAQLNARVKLFRGDRAPRDLRGTTAVIVDDGIATGATARVACAVARGRGAERVVLAVPVAPPRSAVDLTQADLTQADLTQADLTQAEYAPAPLSHPESRPARPLTAWADEVICVAVPQKLAAVGAHYRDFDATSDAEVVRLLEVASRGIHRR